MRLCWVVQDETLTIQLRNACGGGTGLVPLNVSYSIQMWGANGAKLSVHGRYPRTPTPRAYALRAKGPG
jgi:hypothetical protein